jgi:hypothetical protein
MEKQTQEQTSERADLVQTLEEENIELRGGNEKMENANLERLETYRNAFWWAHTSWPEFGKGINALESMLGETSDPSSKKEVLKVLAKAHEERLLYNKAARYYVMSGASQEAIRCYVNLGNSNGRINLESDYFFKAFKLASDPDERIDLGHKALDELKKCLLDLKAVMVVLTTEMMRRNAEE